MGLGVLLAILPVSTSRVPVANQMSGAVTTSTIDVPGLVVRLRQSLPWR
jgi:hypothetical protein